jgi:hypothetical protein
MFPFITHEAWAEYLRANGYDPAAFAAGTSYEESTKCEICKAELNDDPYVILEPPPGLIVRRIFHMACLTAHLAAHVDDLKDELTNYINRKIVSS